jgi:hypothetical protein
VLKVENEIMELFIAYGLCRILEDNGIQWSLTNQQAYFLIETEEDFDYQDLILSTITLDDAWNFASIHNKNETLKRIHALNEFFDSAENMEKIFSFYENPQNTMNEEKAKLVLGKSLSKENAIYSGTVYYTKGIRGKLTPKGHEVLELQSKLSLLGFLSTATYVATDHEINAVLIPKKTNELRIPFVFSSVNKETGEIKRRTNFGREPILIVNARLFVESLKKLKTESMIDSYSSILFMRLSPTGNKPMPDKTAMVPIIHASMELYEEWLKWLEWSIFPDEVKYALSAWLLEQTVPTFIQFLKVASKNQLKFKKEIIEEWVQLQPEKIQEIFKHDSIKALGRGLGRLLQEKKGFPMQVALLNCQTVDVFVKTVRDILISYKKEYEYSLLTDKQVEEIMELVSAYGDDINIISNAIVTYGATFFEKQ